MYCIEFKADEIIYSKLDYFDFNRVNDVNECNIYAYFYAFNLINMWKINEISVMFELA